MSIKRKILLLTTAILSTASMASAQSKNEHSERTKLPVAPSTVGVAAQQGAIDVNGDGIGDYASGDPRGAGGRLTSTGCSACNGPSKGVGNNGGGSDGGGSDKIICTAMNAAYGFGTYRQAIWLAHAARDMTPYHQTGYHLLALPLIRTAYGSDSRTARIVRSSIEHMARERTADIRAEMRGGKRRRLGRAYRAVLEPLCYLTGWLAGGRSIDAIKDVPIIAAALPTRTSHTKGQIHA